MTSITVVWGLVFLTAVVAELISVSFITIWFSLGALVAFLLARAGFGVEVQIIAFIVVSVVTLIGFRPMCKKLMRNTDAKTNKDALIGARAVAEEDVTVDKGRVRIGGNSWAARSYTGKTYEKDSELKVMSIEGVKAIVCDFEEYEKAVSK